MYTWHQWHIQSRSFRHAMVDQSLHKVELHMISRLTTVCIPLYSYRGSFHQCCDSFVRKSVFQFDIHRCLYTVFCRTLACIHSYKSTKSFPRRLCKCGGRLIGWPFRYCQLRCWEHTHRYLCMPCCCSSAGNLFYRSRSIHHEYCCNSPHSHVYDDPRYIHQYLCTSFCCCLL